MSDEKQESTADILAELRNLSGAVTYFELQPTVCGKPISNYFAEIADRIEAAAKREREAAEADALSVGGVVEAGRHTPGNAAELREALEEIRRRLVAAYVSEANFIRYSPNKPLVDLIDAALSAPSRNCDVGTAEEQTKRRQRYCKWRQASLSSNRTCRGCPVYDVMMKNANEAKDADCDLIWAQMPYEAKEGAGE